MALTVEDGSGITGANTYVSLVDCGTYHTNLGNTTWTGSDAAKTSAIYRAMAWMENQAFKGYPVVYEQDLEWPRYGVTDRNGYAVESDDIPPQIIKALCEAALIELVSAGALRPALKRGGQVTEQTISGAVSVKYASGAPTTTDYTVISGLLSGLTKSKNIITVELA
jgi:hypothetical protein